MPSVAVVVGSSQGIGLQLARIFLSQTNMQVVALSRNSSAAKEAILDTSTSPPILAQTNAGLGSTKQDAFNHMDVGKAKSALDANRLTAVDVDVRDEESIRRASEQVKGDFGADSVRLVLNVAGMVRGVWSLGGKRRGGSDPPSPCPAASTRKEPGAGRV